MDEVLEEKRVRHIDSFIKEHPEALKITSGAGKIIYKKLLGSVILLDELHGRNARDAVEHLGEVGIVGEACAEGHLDDGYLGILLQQLLGLLNAQEGDVFCRADAGDGRNVNNDGHVDVADITTVIDIMAELARLQKSNF